MAAGCYPGIVAVNLEQQVEKNSKQADGRYPPDPIDDDWGIWYKK